MTALFNVKTNILRSTDIQIYKHLSAQI